MLIKGKDVCGHMIWSHGRRWEADALSEKWSKGKVNQLDTTIGLFSRDTHTHIKRQCERRIVRQEDRLTDREMGATVKNTKISETHQSDTEY